MIERHDKIINRLALLLTTAALAVAVGCGPSGPTDDQDNASTDPTAGWQESGGGTTTESIDTQPAAPTELGAGGTVPPGMEAVAGLLEQAQTTQQELQEIGGRLQEIQEKALEDEDVRSKLSALEEAANSEMEKVAPGAVDEMAKLEQMAGELRDNPELNSDDPSQVSEGTQAKLDEFQALQQVMETRQREILAQPEIADLHQAYVDSVQGAMRKIEPEFDQLNDRYNSLLGQMNSFHEQMMEMQGQSAPNASGQVAPLDSALEALESPAASPPQP